MRMYMKFRLTVSTNGLSTRLYREWNKFCFLWFRFGCAWIWLAEKIIQKCRWFSFFVVGTRLSCKTMCAVTAKQHKVRFLVLKRNIQNVAAGFALFTVVETSRFVGWNVNTLFNFTCWTIHISNSLLYFVVHNWFFLSIVVWLKWDIRYQLFIGYHVHLFSAEKKRVSSVFVVFTCSCNIKGTLWTNNQALHFPQQ